MTDTVNDARVKSIITTAMAQQSPKAGETVVNSVSRAFRVLQNRRRTVEPLSIDLAAAEHYMYARFLAGISGDPVVKAAASLYGLKKRAYFALGIQDRMATTKMPVLPPSKDVERWGLQGANDGLEDYKASTGKPPTNFGNALSALASEGKRYN